MKRIVFVLLFIVSIKANSQLVGTPYIVQNHSNQFFVLDNLSELPTVAYSVRKISKTYHGFCMRVRRGSDNQSLDIGFDNDGNLNVNYLLNFIGSSNGFVSIWYDQSNSGRHLTQPTQIYQPKIVDSGDLITKNGRPFVSFFAIPSSTTYNHMDVSGGTISNNAQVIIVNAFGSINGSNGFLLGHSTDFFRWHSENGVRLFHNGFASSSILNGQLYINGISSSTLTAPYHTTLKVISLVPQSSNYGTEWNVIGRDRNVHHTSNGGGYSEIMSFSNPISDIERTAIENSAILYYGLN